MPIELSLRPDSINGKDATLWSCMPDENFGFLIKLETEEYYRSMIFASSDHPDVELRPRLEVFYTVKE